MGWWIEADGTETLTDPETGRIIAETVTDSSADETVANEKA
ncbi:MULTISPECIES: hypothetical protein [Amycolatopsis]|uniref:PepSY domain-containing protein n=1 Tax=Amycolatopsis albidoflavus TaxID=102226 RepID=A0ABW5HW83_9PSEU